MHDRCSPLLLEEEALNLLEDPFEEEGDDVEGDWLLRQECRESLISYTIATHPNYTPGRFHHTIAHHLERVERGECRRLILVLPPGHGKSELTSIRFPAWYLGHHPTKDIILTCYGMDLAREFSSKCRDLVDSPAHRFIFDGEGLDPNARASDRWKTSKGGGMIASGVGGSITGKRGKIIIVDDPIKNQVEAESMVHLDKLWEWYKSVLLTRVDSKAAIILCGTRWVPHDLHGRLITLGEGDPFEVVRFPAFNEETGQWLWPEHYTEGEYLDLRDTLGPQWWGALYMGDPKPRKGQLFDQTKVKIITSPPPPEEVLRRVLYWDKAASQDKGCYTAGVEMVEVRKTFTPYRWAIVKVTRGRWATDEREEIIKKEGFLAGRGVKIYIEQEPGSGGKDSAHATITNLAGLDIQADRPVGKKELRATPFSVQVNQGNVALMVGPWVEAYLDEMKNFPNGTFKDQIDASAGAFMKHIGGFKSIGGWSKGVGRG